MLRVSRCVHPSSGFYGLRVTSEKNDGGGEGQYLPSDEFLKFIGVSGRQRKVFVIECRVEECDAHVVNLFDIASGRHFSVPLEQTTVNHDQSTRRMQLEAPAGLWTTTFSI